MNDFVQVVNAGMEIVSTNYWQTEMAEKGYVYLSINAGCFRLLVPKGKGIPLADITCAELVIVSRGPWPEAGKHDAFEILFEDNTDNPFCLHIVPGQVDRLPLMGDRDRPGTEPKWFFAVYNQDGKVAEFPARYRLVKKIPCLKGWTK
jgi:hypothetical protein